MCKLTIAHISLFLERKWERLWSVWGLAHGIVMQLTVNLSLYGARRVATC